MTLTDRELLGRKAFGTFIRATRNCFSYSGIHDSYIRIRPLDENREFFEVEACPASEIPSRTRGNAHSKKRGLAYLDLQHDPSLVRRLFQTLPFSRADAKSYRIWTMQLVDDRLRIVEGYSQQH